MMLFPEKKHRVLCSWEFRENGEKSGSLEETVSIFCNADMPEIQTFKMNACLVIDHVHVCGVGAGGAFPFWNLNRGLNSET